MPTTLGAVSWSYELLGTAVICVGTVGAALGTAVFCVGAAGDDNDDDYDDARADDDER